MGLEKFDIEEIVAVFDEVLDFFSTDETNAQIVKPMKGVRNPYDESDTTWEVIEDIFLIEIGDPHKQDFTTAGDLGTSKTWFVVKPAISKKIDTGTYIMYSPHKDIPKRRYVVRIWEMKNLRGQLIVGYGCMERLAT